MKVESGKLKVERWERGGLSGYGKPVEFLSEPHMEEHGGDRQPDDEADPHADRPHPQREGADQPDRQRDNYIGYEGIDHRPAYIGQAAQHSRPDTLHSVGVLEESRTEDKRRGNVDDNRVGCEEHRNTVAQANHQEGADRVHHQHEMDTGIRRHPRGIQIALAQLVGDTYGGGTADANRQHKGEVGNLRGNLIGGNRLLAQPSDNDGGESEDKGLNPRLHTDGRSDLPQLSKHGADRPAASVAEIPPPLPAAPDEDKEKDRQQRARDKRGNARTRRAHSGQSEMTVDKDVVECNIQEVHDNGYNHCHGGIAQAFQELLFGAEKEKRHKGNDNEQIVHARILDHQRVLPQRAKKRYERRQRHHRQDNEHKRENHTRPQEMGNACVLGAVRRRRSLVPDLAADQRRDAHQSAHGKDHDREENGIGQGHRRQGSGGVVPDHHRVHQTHQRRTSMSEHDRQGNLQIATVIRYVVTERHCCLSAAAGQVVRIYSTLLPTRSRYFRKASREMTTVPRQSWGWKLSDWASFRRLSRKRMTWCSVSLIKPNGLTLPGSSPRYRIIRSGEAKESLPGAGSPCATKTSLSQCSMSWMARS